ncbi:MAG: hypothetical protein A3H93_06990 [Rhodocyclales bacterium RIFCSPLOWO2_02_FULL_63_24]|nr:MAG: hypothetical protein A3H93_06990 [Rhodocyclales bacterium RIFCSPLOWO2_02_FULL_63_24]
MNTIAPHNTAVSSGVELGFRIVNPHCLGRIVQLSETHQVIAASDIHDDSGNKLWARGAPVSRDLHDKLLRRSLAHPLEASLSIEGGATMESIVADALARIDEHEVFAGLAGSARARGLLRDMRRMPLPGPVKLLLTSAREHKQSSYAHGLAAMVVCAGLAAQLELSAHDANMLIVAAMVHDIGEIYINPEYLNADQPVSLAAWKHVASHPCVGHAFVTEFTTFPSAVAACVLHHHERLDGSGYPFQLGASALDRLSSILAVADSVSAIVLRGGCGIRKRLEVALRIVPEEFDRRSVSVINAALRDIRADACDAGQGNCIKRVVPMLRQLGEARAAADALAAAGGSAAIDACGRYALSILGHIEKSLRATGVFDLSQLATIESDPQVVSEICLIVPEVSWRLINLARNLHMRIEKSGNADELARVSGLIAALDPPRAAG